MNDTVKSKGKYWLMFLVSLVATIAFLVVLPEWFWVVLPFLLTSFVLAMDWI